MFRLQKFVIVGIAMLFLLVSFAYASLQDGLVLYLPFDEGSGTVAKDLSGNKHDGAINGATWVDGKFGKALNFDGKGNFVEVPYTDSFAITDGITLGAWVTANVPFSLNWKGIINARKSSYGPYLLQTGADPVKPLGEMGVFTGGGLTNWVYMQTQTSVDKTFHHIVGTYDTATGFHMYFDGKSEDGVTNFAAPAKTIDADPAKEGIAIGHNYGFDPRWWDGIIDEVIVYNRALSADEVAQLFKAPLVSNTSAVTAGKLTSTWGSIKGTE